MLVFLWKELDTRSSRLVLVSAIGCLALAVVLDFFEGLEPDHALNVHTYISDNTNLARVSSGGLQVRFGPKMS